MTFSVVTSSLEGTEAVLAISRALSGQAQHSTPFAEQEDDGTGTFPELEPEESRVKQAGVKAHELVKQREVLNYRLALRRDAMYMRASRGRLLLQGAQGRALVCYEARRQMELAFA